MNKRKRRTLFAALASVVFLTVCTSAYLNYGFNRDVVATPEDFDISMEVLEMPGNENGGKVKVKCRLQNATLSVQRKYGKNAILKGMNLLEGGTTIERNGQIGGHRA